MKKRRGTFIVLEGTDGSGKTVQFEMLKKKLSKAGVNVLTFDFPQYKSESTYFIKQYLNGKYGSWQEVGPYRASTFYAMDRYDVGLKIKKALAQGKMVLSNRYVASNMGHQGAKIKSRAARRRFFKWVYEFEHGILEIPKPALTFVLHVPARVAYKRIEGKGRREYLYMKKRDIHEADIEHLKRAEHAYLEVVKMFRKDFKFIECMKQGVLLSPEAVHKKVWAVVQNFINKK